MRPPFPKAPGRCNRPHSTFWLSCSIVLTKRELLTAGKYVERVALPYVFKYLVSELAAMNIRCSLDLAPAQ